MLEELLGDDEEIKIAVLKLLPRAPQDLTIVCHAIAIHHLRSCSKSPSNMLEGILAQRRLDRGHVPAASLAFQVLETRQCRGSFDSVDVPATHFCCMLLPCTTLHPICCLTAVHIRLSDSCLWMQNDRFAIAGWEIIIGAMGDCDSDVSCAAFTAVCATRWRC
jgi:hypothetical protein